MCNHILRKIFLCCAIITGSFRVVKIIVMVMLFISFIDAYAENAMRDPTQPSSHHDDSIITNVPSSDIVITAIFTGVDRKLVMVGNHPFTVGEKISGQTIIDIDTKGIILKSEDGSERRVDMLYSTIKIPTTNNKKEKP